MTGIVAAIPYAFIFPPALYLKLDPNASMVHSGKVLAVLQLAFGVVFFVLGLTGRVICLVKNTTFCRSSQKEKDNHQSLQCYHGNHGNIVTMVTMVTKVTMVNMVTMARILTLITLRLHSKADKECIRAARPCVL